LAVFTAELPKQMSFDDLLDTEADSADSDIESSITASDSAEKSVPDNSVYISKKLDAALRRSTVFHDQEPTVNIENADRKNDDIPDATEISQADMYVSASESDNFLLMTDKQNIHVLPDVIPPALRAESRGGKRHVGLFIGMFWSVAILVMIVIGVAQYAWYDRMHLLQYPQARPWFELACDYLHCQLPEARDPSLIELSRKNIYTHPNDKRGLMVSGTMLNKADFAQSFPLLELRFENIRGEALAVRRFAPDEYLDLPRNQIAKMQPGEPVTFTLEIVDPGPDVVSYEFTFL
jgi:hypothetical protein